MSAWRWVGLRVVQAVHDRQIAEHGGLAGVRDAAAIESGLGRPRNLAAYGQPDAAALAAAYLHGLVCNHGFVDGNKRTAWVVARVFLSDHGHRLRHEAADAVRMVEAIAVGALSEQQTAVWFRDRLEPAA